MATKHDLMSALTQHVGIAKKISAEDLAKKIGLTNTRQLRHLTDEVIEEGIALCSHPSYGYFIAETKEELQRTIDFHKSRAMHELMKVSHLSKMPLEDLVGQLHLNT